MRNTVVPHFGDNRGHLLVAGALLHATLVAAWWLMDDREVARELWTAFAWAWLLWAIVLADLWKHLSQVDRAAFAIAAGVIAAFVVTIYSNTSEAIKELFAS